ncbi:MAG: D-aminoacyl-tRNA deacylase [Candidatus Bipolaricaulia bacterium]
MRLVIQRVSEARVDVDGTTVGQIGPGLLVLVGAHADDEPASADHLAKKTAKLRIFPDDKGRMNRSVVDIGGGVLAVSQFTLYGDTRKGNRPSFTDAAPPEQAEPLLERYVAALREQVAEVETGQFGAMMDVGLVNDGPVTLVLDHPEGPATR